MNLNKIVPQKPFTHPQSERYLDAIKKDNYDEVKNLVDLHGWLVYEFDKQNQTGLHWAAKRGYSDILLFLIKHNANINAKDILGRTPLWIAWKYNQTQEVRLLLSNKANSFIKSANNKLIETLLILLWIGSVAFLSSSKFSIFIVT